MMWLCVALAALCILVTLAVGLVLGYAIGRGARSPRSLESARIFLAEKAKAEPTPQPERPVLPPEYRTKFTF